MEAFSSGAIPSSILFRPSQQHYLNNQGKEAYSVCIERSNNFQIDLTSTIANDNFGNNDSRDDRIEILAQSVVDKADMHRAEVDNIEPSFVVLLGLIQLSVL